MIMTEKELKSLRRADLLEMLIESEKQREQAAKNYQHTIDELKAQILDLTEQLTSRRIMIEESGTLAEACLRVNGVLNSAQNTADQYLENIMYRHRNLEAECNERIASCQNTAMTILNETREKCLMLEKRAHDASYEILKEAELKRQATEEECEQMRAEAREYADAYFQEKNGKLQQVLEAYGTMESLLKNIEME